MDVATTYDGQQVTLQPCPSWCTGDHFEPGAYLHLQDGFHHTSEPINIITTHVSRVPDGKPTTVQMHLQAFVTPLDAPPGRTQVELSLLDSDFSAVTLTPELAHRVAEILHELGEQAAR